MPIYGYLCATCGYQKDVLQKMSDAALTTCPECQQTTFTKQVSAPSFRLSGSGWYETDFKTGQKKNLAGEQSDSVNKETLKENTKDTAAKCSSDVKTSGGSNASTTKNTTSSPASNI